jgi:hypothetical protein
LIRIRFVTQRQKLRRSVSCRKTSEGNCAMRRRSGFSQSSARHTRKTQRKWQNSAEEFMLLIRWSCSLVGIQTKGRSFWTGIGWCSTSLDITFFHKYVPSFTSKLILVVDLFCVCYFHTQIPQRAALQSAFLFA